MVFISMNQTSHNDLVVVSFSYCCHSSCYQNGLNIVNCCYDNMYKIVQEKVSI